MRRKGMRYLMGILLLAALGTAGPAAAVYMDDYYLLEQYTATGVPGGNFRTPLTYFQLNPFNVDPLDPDLVGIDVGFAVTYGSLSPVDYGVFFEFANMSTDVNAGAVLTSLYFDTSGLVADPHVVEYGSGDNLSYVVDDSSFNGGGFQLDFDLEATPTAPHGGVIAHGVGSGENMLIGFSLANVENLTLSEREAAAQNLIIGLVGGEPSVTDWMVTGHLQATAGGSEWLASHVDTPGPRPQDPVPEPAATVALFGLGVSMLVARRWVART